MSLTSGNPILTRHLTSSDVSLAKIHEKIPNSQEDLRALNAFQNTQTPIYRLPPEILELIFSFVQVNTILDSRSRFQRILQWVEITHVSQYWRQVAITSPRLWSKIKGTYPKDAIDEWIQRSKAVPLSLDFTSHRWPYACYADAYIVSSLVRLQDLNLALYPQSWDTLSPNLSSPAPLLESLVIENWAAIGDTKPLTISESLFAGTTPRLRRLQLRGCSAKLSLPIFRDLTSLTLCIHDPKVSASDLLDTIRKLPRLISLSLAWVLDAASAVVPPSSSDIIALSSLERLSLHGDCFIQDLNIFSHLSFPANTAVSFRSASQSRNIITTLMDFLTAHKAARHQFLPYLTSLELSHDRARDFTSIIMKHLVDVCVIVPGGGTMHISDTSGSTLFLSSLPLQSIISFKTDCNIDVGIWIDKFGCLPDLTYITASGESAFNILAAIIENFKTTCPAARGDTEQETRSGEEGSTNRESTTDSISNSGPHPQQAEASWSPIFPSLEFIMVEDANLPECLTDLVAALRARSMVNKRIEELCFKGCRNGTADLVDSLGKCVRVCRVEPSRYEYDSDEYLWNIL